MSFLLVGRYSLLYPPIRPRDRVIQTGMPISVVLHCSPPRPFECLAGEECRAMCSLRFNRFAEPLPPLSWRGLFLYFILLDSTAMLSHCLLYHGEVSQNYDKLADLQYPTNHLDCVRFVPLRRSPAISRRLRHHQSKAKLGFLTAAGGRRRLGVTASSEQAYPMRPCGGGSDPGTLSSP